MGTNSLSYHEAKRIPITDYLSGLGFEPAKIRGNDYWYHSPFRQERTPSFKVNTSLNVWYDHGIGEGGSIFELGSRLHQCTLREFLGKLSLGNTHGISLHQQQIQNVKPRNKLEITSTDELTSTDLIHYLNGRGIDVELARKYCKEIEFSIGPKLYNAIGFPNQCGAYELRNSWFKGSSSPKDLSFVNNGEKKVCLLEGFLDFLSVLKIDKGEIRELTNNSDFLVLNSLRLINRSLPILQSHREINLFLDNDLAAKQAKDALKEKGIVYRDASPLYGNHKDVNEYLMETIKNSLGQDRPRNKPRGMRR